jgi:ABC-type multidrug transport system fused ATPase/permease subunit
VIISHRLPAIRKSDKIMVFDLGALVESGMHDELMSRRGTYFDLYNKCIKDVT